MKLIRRCRECRRFYIPSWHGDAEIKATTPDGQPIGKPIHGHPTCLMQVFAADLTPQET